MRRALFLREVAFLQSELNQGLYGIVEWKFKGMARLALSKSVLVKVSTWSWAWRMVLEMLEEQRSENSPQSARGKHQFGVKSLMAEGGEEMRIGKWSLPQREECTFQLEKSIERVLWPRGEKR